MKNIINNIIISEKKENNMKPIFRKCFAAEHGGCFCTGRCKEVIGHIGPDGETVFLKCHHGKLLSGLGCSDCETERSNAVYDKMKT